MIVIRLIKHTTVMVRIPTNRELLRCDLARLIAGDVDLGGTNGSQKMESSHHYDAHGVGGKG